MFEQYATDDDSGMRDIGNFYSEHDDFEKAFEWYSKAVENDDIWAASNLGKLYYQGKGCTQDKAKAEELFEELFNEFAECGNVMKTIGNFYSEQEEFDKAIMWYSRAVDEGDEEAKEKLEELKKKTK